MGRTAKHKTRNDSDANPPSVFASMPTISLLEAVVTKDPRWHWLEAAWDASDDASVRELATFVREHRVTLAVSNISFDLPEGICNFSLSERAFV